MTKSASGTRPFGLGTYALANETGHRERSFTRWTGARIAERGRRGKRTARQLLLSASASTRLIHRSLQLV